MMLLMKNLILDYKVKIMEKI